jgi:hypothetical protein
MRASPASEQGISHSHSSQGAEKEPAGLLTNLILFLKNSCAAQMEIRGGIPMDPVSHVGVIAFLNWISRNHPDIRSLKSLSKEDFLQLATDYEKTRGYDVEIDGQQRLLAWDVTKRYWIDERPNDEEALEDLRRIG